MREDYAAKTDAYFARDREEVLAIVPNGGGTVLDIGCGSGGLGRRLLASGKARAVHGFEFDRRALAMAATVLTGVQEVDLESVPWPARDGSFDVIIAADVLEHLTSPEKALEEAKRLLRPRGTLVVSLPNVRFLPIVWRLVARGRFEYGGDGVLDRTHLRFFTRRSAKALVEAGGFRVVETRSRYCGRRYLWGSRLSLGLLGGLMEEGVLIRAKRLEEGCDDARS